VGVECGSGDAGSRARTPGCSSGSQAPMACCCNQVNSVYTEFVADRDEELARMRCSPARSEKEGSPYGYAMVWSTLVSPHGLETLVRRPNMSRCEG